MSDDVIGCGSPSCVFGRGQGTRYGGQHTNGGCRCLEDHTTGRRLSFVTRKRLSDWIRALRKQRDEAREELVKALREGLAESQRLKAERDEVKRLERAHAEWVKREDDEVEALRAEVKRLRGGGS